MSVGFLQPEKEIDGPAESILMSRDIYVFFQIRGIVWILKRAKRLAGGADSLSALR